VTPHSAGWSDSSTETCRLRPNGIAQVKVAFSGLQSLREQAKR
jgi:hypothetical protein